MLLYKYTEDVYIGNIDWLNLQEEFSTILKDNKVQVVYLATNNFNLYKNKFHSNLQNLRILPFSGGFMLNSIVLFPLKTEEDKKYFEDITELKI
jgi:hypothetical protein